MAAADRGLPRRATRSALDVEHAYRSKNQYDATRLTAPVRRIGNAGVEFTMAADSGVVAKPCQAAKCSVRPGVLDIRVFALHETNRRDRVVGFAPAKWPSHRQGDQEWAEAMWYLIEDFFEQGILVKLFLAVGWLAVVIMIASFIALIMR